MYTRTESHLIANGYIDCKHGLTVCPYEVKSKEWHLWNQGFDIACFNRLLPEMPIDIKTGMLKQCGEHDG